MKLANTYAHWQEYQPALDAYNFILGLQSEAKAQVELGEYRKVLDPLLDDLAKKNDWSSLVSVYEQALQAGFSDSKVNAIWLFKLAEILIDQDLDISKGIAYAIRSQKLDPEQPARLVINTLAQGYVKQALYDEAIAILRDALKIVSDPRDKRVLKSTLKKVQAAKEEAAREKSATQNSSTQPKATP